MKWVSHKVATAAILYSFSGNLIVASLGVLGSTFPDWIEGKPPAQGTPAYAKWRRKHRQSSHWLPPYFLVCLSCFAYTAQFGFLTLAPKTIPLFLYQPSWATISLLCAHILGCYTLGCVLHILQDALCGRVPLIFPKYKIGIRLFTVGSMLEYLLVFPLSVFLIIWRLAADFQILQYLRVPELPKFFM